MFYIVVFYIENRRLKVKSLNISNSESSFMASWTTVIDYIYVALKVSQVRICACGLTCNYICPICTYWSYFQICLPTYVHFCHAPTLTNFYLLLVPMFNLLVLTFTLEYLLVPISTCIYLPLPTFTWFHLLAPICSYL